MAMKDWTKMYDKFMYEFEQDKGKGFKTGYKNISYHKYIDDKYVGKLDIYIYKNKTSEVAYAQFQDDKVFDKRFTSKEKALKFARQYMRTH